MTRTVDVRRILSDTPLAAQHERTLRGDLTRTHKPIPWQAFERGRYPEPALALAENLFAKLAGGEYSAVALFSQITSALALTQAPIDFVAVSARVSSDEIRHADYCLRMAGLCAGHDVHLELSPEALASDAPPALDLPSLDFLMLKYAAVGETLAAALLTECRRRASDPVTRPLFTSIVSDEVHHARLGWYYAAYRAPRWTHAEKQALADRVAEFVVGIEREFWQGRDAAAEHAQAASALGVLDSDTQRRAIRDVMTAEILPGLDALGLGGSATWAVRPRVA